MFRLGSDPEFPCFDKNGNPVPVVGLLGGDKHSPEWLGDHLGGHQEDNVNAEINPSPSVTVEEAVAKTLQLKAVVAEKLKIHGLEIKSIPSVTFDLDVLFEAGYKVMEGGCDPDFNAWKDGDINQPPDLMGPLRTAGGHLLMEIPKDMNYLNFIKMCDYLLGLPSVILDPDTRRRSLYGTAGCYRMKPLSEDSNLIEYRTLSNFWTDTEALMQWAYGTFALVPTMLNKLSDFMTVVPPKQLVNIINNSKVKEAEDAMLSLEDIWASATN